MPRHPPVLSHGRETYEHSMHDLTSRPPSPHFTDGLTEAHAQSHSAVKRAGAGSQAPKPSSAFLWCPHPMASTQWAHGQGWLGESLQKARGPGTVTQLMSGAINRPAFPTAPTCPPWLPFLLMSGPGAGGQGAWVCAENTP